MKQIIRKWHLINAENQILGRLSVSLAHLLMGKGKAGFVRNLDLGDFVVLINSAKVKVTGQKENKKIYYHHTGYPQGLRIESYSEVKSKDPGRIIKHAVSGMLPNNKLRSLWLKRLYIYQDDTHPFTDKFK